MAATSLRAVLGTITTFITNFVNNKNNPTGVTAEQAGAYSKDDINTLLANQLTLDDFPLAVWGDGTVAKGMGVTASGQTLTVPATRLILGGIRGQLQGSVNAALNNGVKMYVYAAAQSGAFYVRLSNTPVVETSTVLALGTVTGNASGGLILDGFQSIVRIAGFRLSTTRVANAIPVSDATGGLGSWQ